MGFNTGGLITKGQFNNLETLEACLETRLERTELQTNFNTASKNHKEGNCIDILTTDKGTLIFPNFGTLYNLKNFLQQEFVVQFLISDVSNTYYFEAYSKGKLLQKWIIADEEIAEDVGESLIDKKAYLLDEIWRLAEAFTGLNSEEIFEASFEQYKILDGSLTTN